MHFVRHAVLVPLLLVLGSCASVTDKYPYPPQFVSVEEICPCALGEPIADGSLAQKKEIANILARQAQLSDADKTRIMAEDHITPSMMITPVLGDHYSEATHPALFTLLRHSASDAWRIGDATQDYWGRTRPWLTDDRVTLLVKPITRPSYPSGHSTTNHIWAHVLSELFPQQRTALFARAMAIGQHRVDGGVHYPSDVLAGKRLAASIYDVMRDHPEFKAELAAARTELRGY